jgi:hypothetical protein
VLSHDDVEPIALFPVTRSNGEVVFQQLEETIEKTGLPKTPLSSSTKTRSAVRCPVSTAW